MINLDPAVLSTTTASEARPTKGGEFVALLARVADEQCGRGCADDTSLAADADLLDEAARQDAEQALATLTEDGAVDLDAHVGGGTALWLLHTALRADAPGSAEGDAGDTEIARALAALAAAAAAEAPVEDAEAVPDELDVADLPQADAEEATADGAEPADVDGALPVDTEGTSAGDAAGEVFTATAQGAPSTSASGAVHAPPSGDAARTGPSSPAAGAPTGREAQATGPSGVVRSVEGATVPAGDGPDVDENGDVLSDAGARAADTEEPLGEHDSRGRVRRGAEPEPGVRESARPVTQSADRVGGEPAGTTPVETTPARAGETAPTSASRTSGATMVERLLEAATRLENLPPPRTLTLEIGEARVRLSMEDGSLRMQLLGQERAADRELLDAAASQLRSRGFDLGGDGAEQDPHGQQDAGDDSPASRRDDETPEPARAAYAQRNTTDLRL